MMMQGAYPSFSAFITRNKSTVCVQYTIIFWCSQLLQPLANGLKVVLKTMQAKAVRRIFALSTPSYRAPGETVRFIFLPLRK